MTQQEMLLYTEEEIASELAKRSSKLRIHLKMTQKDFAKKAGISFATYRKFEQTGQTSLITFLKILRHLGELKEIYDLLSLSDIKKYGIQEYMSLQESGERKRVKTK